MKYINIEDETILPGNIPVVLGHLQAVNRKVPRTFAVLGASVSQGEMVPKGKDYFSYIKEHWKEHFNSDGRPTFINASKPGTLSGNGMFAMGDLIEKKPDVVFLDYSVNDPSDYYLKECFESMVYHFMKSNCFVIILLFCNEKGHSTKGAMLSIARHYNIPCLDIGKIIQQNISDGKMLWSEFGSDYVHPTIFGHELIAKNIFEYLDFVMMTEKKPQQKYKMPADTCLDGTFCNLKIRDNIIYDENDIFCCKEIFSDLLIEFFQCPTPSGCSMDVFVDDEYKLTVDKYSDFSWNNRVVKQVYTSNKNSRHKIQLKPAENAHYSTEELSKLNIKLGFGYTSE